MEIRNWGAVWPGKGRSRGRRAAALWAVLVLVWIPGVAAWSKDSGGEGGAALNLRSDGRIDAELSHERDELELFYAGRRSPEGERAHRGGLSTPQVVVGPLQIRGPVALLSAPMDPPGGTSVDALARALPSLKRSASRTAVVGAVIVARPQWLVLREPSRTTLAVVMPFPHSSVNEGEQIRDGTRLGIRTGLGLSWPSPGEPARSWFPSERRAASELLYHLVWTGFVRGLSIQFGSADTRRGADSREAQFSFLVSGAPRLRPGFAVHAASRSEAKLRRSLEEGEAASQELEWWWEAGMVGKDYAAPDGGRFVPVRAVFASAGAPAAYRLHTGALLSLRSIWRARGEVEGYLAAPPKQHGSRLRERVLWRRRGLTLSRRRELSMGAPGMEHPGDLSWSLQAGMRQRSDAGFELRGGLGIRYAGTVGRGDGEASTLRHTWEFSVGLGLQERSFFAAPSPSLTLRGLRLWRRPVSFVVRARPTLEYQPDNGWSVADLQVKTAMDLGSLSFRLELESRGRLRPAGRESFREAYRIGVGMDWTGRLSPRSQEQTSRVGLAVSEAAKGPVPAERFQSIW